MRGAAVDLINVASGVGYVEATNSPLADVRDGTAIGVLYGTRVLSLEQFRIMLFRSQLSGQLMYQAQLK